MLLAWLPKIGVSCALLALALEDLRRQEVRWLLPVSLIAVVVLRSLTGLPALGVLLGALLVAGERCGLFHLRSILAGTLVVFALWISACDGSRLAVLMWLLVIAQWRANILGGADAQLQLLLMALFPSLTMLELLLVVPSAVRVWYLLRGRRGRQPMLPAYAVAGLVQLWLLT